MVYKDLFLTAELVNCGEVILPLCLKQLGLQVTGSVVLMDSHDASDVVVTCQGAFLHVHLVDGGNGKSAPLRVDLPTARVDTFTGPFENSLLLTNALRSEA